MRYFIAISTIGYLCILLVNANNVSIKILNSKPPKSVIYNLLVHFLKSCDLNLKRIVVYNSVSDQDTFSAITELQPQTSVILISDDINEWQQAARYRVDDMKIDAVVVVIKVENAWILMQKIFRIWRFNRDCIVYIFPIPLNNCGENGTILKLAMRFYFPAAYYICHFMDRSIHVYTHDPYGDTEPPHWIKVFQGLRWGKNWSFYARSYEKDMKELCAGFYFERTDLVNKTFPILGVYNENIFTVYKGTGDVLVTEKDIKPYLYPVVQSELKNLKRLLKVRFDYYIIEPSIVDEMLTCAYAFSSTDIIINPRMAVVEDPWWSYFYSTHIESYAIISHNRGFMTPLEKIADYYGIWTLSSLLVMLGITFIVTWLKTKKVSKAAFDVIKLLINSDVTVPINTPALKIFFSAVFLYFLIIHATFSGHLPEFLTSIAYKPNIEALEDLKDPRVEKIYYFGYRFNEDEELDDLRQKSESIWLSGGCYRIWNEPNSACIAPLSDIINTWVNLLHQNEFYYVSKNTFGLSLISPLYRPGFPLYEEFNWAFMYLFDTGITIQFEKILSPSEFKLLNKDIVLLFTQYRQIDIKELYFAFVLLIVGNCVALICFLFEIGFKMISNKKKNHRLDKKVVKIVVEPQ